MPKIVDAELRRAEIVAAAGALIAREGYEAATIRQIASESGYSTGVVDHYFVNKDELLLRALEASHRTIVQRFDDLVAGLRGLSAVRAVIADNLPVDAQRQQETRLEMEFWARCLRDDSLHAVQVREMNHLRHSLELCLVHAVEDGEVAGDVDLTAAVEALLVVMDGVSVRAVISPDLFPAGVQLALLDEQIALLAATASRAVAPRRRSG